MTEPNELDELFRQNLQQASVPAPPGVWESVAASVSASSAATGAVASWLIATKWAIGTVVVAAVSWAAYHFASVSETNQPKSAVNSESAPQQNQQKPQAEGNSKTSGQQAGTNSGNASISSGNSTGTDIPTFASAGNGSGAVQPGIGEPATNGGENGNKNNPSGVTTEPPKPQPQPVKPQTKPAISAPSGCPKTLSVNETKTSETGFRLDALRSNGTVTWYLGDPNGSTGFGTSTEFVYPENTYASYEVMAVSVSEKGCRDTARKTILTSPRVTNFFSPNGDGKNEEYVPAYFINTQYFDISMYDNLGRPVFHSDNPDKRWNGNCGAVVCPSGRYKMVLVYKLQGQSRPVTIIDYITLER